MKMCTDIQLIILSCRQQLALLSGFSYITACVFDYFYCCNRLLTSYVYIYTVYVCVCVCVCTYV